MPGLGEQLVAEDNQQLQMMLAQMEVADVPYLYWAAAGWVAAFSTDPFDLELGLSIPRAFTLIERALELEASFGNGVIHEFLVAYYAGLPEGLGGDRELARYHFDQALDISGGIIGRRLHCSGHRFIDTGTKQCRVYRANGAGIGHRCRGRSGEVDC